MLEIEGGEACQRGRRGMNARGLAKEEGGGGINVEGAYQRGRTRAIAEEASGEGRGGFYIGGLSAGGGRSLLERWLVREREGDCWKFFQGQNA